MILPLQTEGHPNSLLHGDLPNKWYRAVSRTSDNASGRRFRKLRRRVHVVQEVAHELVDAPPHAGSEGGLEVAPVLLSSSSSSSSSLLSPGPPSACGTGKSTDGVLVREGLERRSTSYRSTAFGQIFGTCQRPPEGTTPTSLRHTTGLSMEHILAFTRTIICSEQRMCTEGFEAERQLRRLEHRHVP